MAFPEVIGHPGARNTCLYVVMTPEDSMFTRAKPIEATMVRNALHECKTEQLRQLLSTHDVKQRVGIVIQFQIHQGI